MIYGVEQSDAEAEVRLCILLLSLARNNNSNNKVLRVIQVGTRYNLSPTF